MWLPHILTRKSPSKDLGLSIRSYCKNSSESEMHSPEFCLGFFRRGTNFEGNLPSNKRDCAFITLVSRQTVIHHTLSSNSIYEILASRFPTPASLLLKGRHQISSSSHGNKLWYSTRQLGKCIQVKPHIIHDRDICTLPRQAYVGCLHCTWEMCLSSISPVWESVCHN